MNFSHYSKNLVSIMLIIWTLLIGMADRGFRRYSGKIINGMKSIWNMEIHSGRVFFISLLFCHLQSSFRLKTNRPNYTSASSVVIWKKLCQSKRWNPADELVTNYLIVTYTRTCLIDTCSHIYLSTTYYSPSLPSAFAR